MNREGELAEKRTRPKVREISVPMNVGPDRTAKARMFGELGVHEAVDVPGLWVVTHVPTGRSVLEVRPKRRAFTAARKLQRLAWKEVRTPSRIKRWRHYPKMRDAINAMWLKWYRTKAIA